MKAVILLLLTFTAVACAGKDEWKGRSIYQLMTDRFARGDGLSPNCDLGNYCGGNYDGIMKHLDYIKNMGFDAIWISPMVQNTDGSYHGYHLTDLYKMNTNFGDEGKMKELVAACHSKDIWVMLDVVANHVGPVGDDFGRIAQFNSGEHYHDNCDITDWGNQPQVENCRLAGLPDLKQENEYVANTLLEWIHYATSTYGFDGIRIDTVPEVPTWFWDKFRGSAAVFQIGEVFNGNPGYVAGYQNHLDSVFNYPLYYKIENAFKGSMKELENYMNNDRGAFPDPTVLGVFIENHDNPRFLNRCGDRDKFTNAAILSIMWEGIPVWYYGGEQYYSGGADPNNREPLWDNYNQDSDLYKKLATANYIRKDKKIWNSQQVQKYADDSFYAFQRGDVLVCVTNSGDGGSREISNLSYGDGTRLLNVLESGDEVTVNGGKIQVTMNKAPKIYVVQ